MNNCINFNTFHFFVTILICGNYSHCFNVGVKSECDNPKTILVHTPKREVFYGLLHANAALYEDSFDRYAAKKEHRKYIEELVKKNARVIQIVDVLLKGTMNSEGSKRNGKSLEELKNFACESLTYFMPNYWKIKEKDHQKKYKKEILENLHPKDLVSIILENPTLTLKKSKEKNTEFVAEPYGTSPMMNMHFLRDQQITTDKGIVMGKMNSTQRGREVDIMELVFKKLGVEPIYKVKGKGRLEGGDFMPAGNFALIGQGLRTNAEGIKQLLENNVFDFPEIAVVKDPFQHQDQMHLDTYFNILGNRKALVNRARREEGVLKRDGITRPIRPKIDVYKKTSSGEYRLTKKNIDFFMYLEKEKGFNIIDIEDKEQLNYGCNFLCVGDNDIIGVKNVSKEYPKKLERFGVNVTLVDFENITKSYGGPHCTTQVVLRD